LGLKYWDYANKTAAVPKNTPENTEMWGYTIEYLSP